MMTKRFPLYISLSFLLFSGITTAQAQHKHDSLAQQTIDIYNIYQPKLPAAAKINLNAGLPESKQKHPNLVYSIPSQNLDFSYRSVALRPLAMGIDTSYHTLYNNYIKAGFGNLSTPLIQAGFSNGDHLPYQIGANFSYLSSKGKIKDQQFSKADLLLHGKYFTPNNVFYAQVGYHRNGIRYYGYDHENPPKSRDSIKQAFNIISLEIGGQNIKSNLAGIDYQPKIGFSSLFDKYNRKETSFSLDLPAQKSIGNNMSISAAFRADLSKYKDDDSSFSNNIVAIEPAFHISNPKFKLKVGVSPTWSQGDFYLFPDIVNETNLLDDHIILSSGWTVHFKKNTYQNTVSENPFIGSFSNLLNTRIAERYTGIKGAINSHFSYNIKIASVDFHDRPLYLADPAKSNRFSILNEEDLKSFEFHAELGYALGNKFNAKLSGSWYNFYDQNTENTPWGLRPFQSDLALQYRALDKLELTADLYALSGSWYKTPSGAAEKTNGAFDVNLGGNYNFTNQFSIWLKLNNLLNNHYERWSQYPTMGLNVIGGIMITF